MKIDITAFDLEKVTAQDIAQIFEEAGPNKLKRVYETPTIFTSDDFISGLSLGIHVAGADGVWFDLGKSLRQLVESVECGDCQIEQNDPKLIKAIATLEKTVKALRRLKAEIDSP